MGLWFGWSRFRDCGGRLGSNGVRFREKVGWFGRGLVSLKGLVDGSGYGGSGLGTKVSGLADCWRMFGLDKWRCSAGVQGTDEWRLVEPKLVSSERGGRIR